MMEENDTNKNVKSIDSIDSLFKLLKQYQDQDEKCVFRGVNEIYEGQDRVNSGLYRSIKDLEKNKENSFASSIVLSMEEDMVERAKTHFPARTKFH